MGCRPFIPRLDEFVQIGHQVAIGVEDPRFGDLVYDAAVVRHEELAKDSRRNVRGGLEGDVVAEPQEVEVQLTQVFCNTRVPTAVNLEQVLDEAAVVVQHERERVEPHAQDHGV